MDRQMFDRGWFSGKCDKCFQPVPPWNDATRIESVAHNHNMTIFFYAPRHFLPTPTCQGSPSRAQYIEGQPRDRRGYDYIPGYEAMWRSAYALVQLFFSDLTLPNDFLSKVTIKPPPYGSCAKDAIPATAEKVRACDRSPVAVYVTLHGIEYGPMIPEMTSLTFGKATFQAKDHCWYKVSLCYPDPKLPAATNIRTKRLGRPSRSAQPV